MIAGRLWHLKKKREVVNRTPRHAHGILTAPWPRINVKTLRAFDRMYGQDPDMRPYVASSDSNPLSSPMGEL